MYAISLKRSGGGLATALLSVALATTVVQAPRLGLGAVAGAVFLLANGDIAEARRHGGGHARHSSHHPNHRPDHHPDHHPNHHPDDHHHHHHDYDHWHNDHDHYGRWVAAGVTAAAIGSIIYSLRGGCRTVVSGGVTYYECGGVWYAPRYQGASVVYVVVSEP